MGQEHYDCTRNRLLVFFGEFVHTQNGDDVLQFLQSLQHGLHTTRAVIVLLTDNERVENA